MNWLYHFRLRPWELGQFNESELDAIAAALEQMKRDAKT